ncbi:MAG: CPBP family intramembrane metalloprotease [Gemmataceae bacterium]|nr:CPBP family intramembrane metalloprotease [Gemmataceae bacterium]
MPSTPEANAFPFSWKDWLLEPIRLAEQQRDASGADEKKNLRALIGLLGGCVCLLLLRFLFLQDEQSRWLDLAQFLGADSLAKLFQDFFSHPLGRLSFWMFGCVLCYAVIPMALVRLALGERPADFGLRGFDFKKTLPWLLLALVVMAPLVWMASGRPRFLLVYPFYEPARVSFPAWDFFLWEVLYAFQFLALELFFRGFLIHSTIPVIGAWSIPVMVIPYCMIHFHKPFLEAFAAILAGVFLGWLGIKTKSIFPGAILHIMVAWSMDVLALSQKGYWV